MKRFYDCEDNERQKSNAIDAICEVSRLRALPIERFLRTMERTIEAYEEMFADQAVLYQQLQIEHEKLKKATQ